MLVVQSNHCEFDVSIDDVVDLPEGLGEGGREGTRDIGNRREVPSPEHHTTCAHEGGDSERVEQLDHQPH